MKISEGLTGGQILVQQLQRQGVDHVFCVPGESYLAVLDALHDTEIAITVCRQEGGAAMMAEAYGKLTGRPGIAFVTRGPGATNASAGVHIAHQDSTPMILFVGQIERGMRGREAFQELDYRAVFSSMTKWSVEVDDAARLPELVARAFTVAMSGRPGPVVMALPEDMLTELAMAPAAARVDALPCEPDPENVGDAMRLLAQAERPLVIAGGSRWDQQAVDRLVEMATASQLPVAVSFRRQSLFPADHPNYIGEIGVAADPALVAYARSADVILLLGGRLSELPSQSYTLLSIPQSRQKLIHVHPGIEELGRVYQAEIAINATPAAFLRRWGMSAAAPVSKGPATALTEMRKAYETWNRSIKAQPGPLNFGTVVQMLSDSLPETVVITSGAGNYATWVHRHFRHLRFGSQLAPTSGSMGYGVPAAVAAARIRPDRPVVAFAGDGCFLMHGQEFATAVQYELPVIFVVIDNGMYGTIRMHQEREYPGRVSGTMLRNPDFAAYAQAFGGYGERVEMTADFMPAFERARKSGLPSIIHCLVDPEALTPTRTLSELRDLGLSTQRMASAEQR